MEGDPTTPNGRTGSIRTANPSSHNQHARTGTWRKLVKALITRRSRVQSRSATIEQQVRGPPCQARDAPLRSISVLELDLHGTGYNIVAMIDGPVVEIFGPLSDDSSRAHVKFLSLEVSGPDKKGRRDILLNRGGGIMFLLLGKLDDAQFAAAQPLLDALTNAGVSTTP
jgi:hypothetical protein